MRQWHDAEAPTWPALLRMRAWSLTSPEPQVSSPASRDPQPAPIGRQGLTTTLWCTSTSHVTQCHYIVPAHYEYTPSVIQCRPIRAGCGALPTSVSSRSPSCLSSRSTYAPRRKVLRFVFKKHLEKTPASLCIYVSQCAGCLIDAHSRGVQF